MKKWISNNWWWIASLIAVGLVFYTGMWEWVFAALMSWGGRGIQHERRKKKNLPSREPVEPVETKDRVQETAEEIAREEPDYRKESFDKEMKDFARRLKKNHQ